MLQYVYNELLTQYHIAGWKRRGLGPRNDVLTTCKAVTLRGGQRIIEVSFPQLIFLDFLEEAEEKKKEEESVKFIVSKYIQRAL